MEVYPNIRKGILKNTEKNNTVMKKLPVKKNINVPTVPKKSFAETTNSQVKDLHFNLDMLKKLQEEIVIDGNTAIMDLIEEEIEEERRRAVIFRT